ncbi:MAG: hypothetical protein CMM61_17560 [Rhodospirillaceae bacterium]|nr:hypothetical protein [Rhodospirillaceae bacterium]
MGGTSGGPQALPSPPASGTEGAAAGSPSGGTADVDDGGLYGDPIGPGSGTADLAAPLPPSFLTDGVGLGQPNLPDDVFFSSSLMAENGILDAPTFVATPEYLGGLRTAQEMLGTKPDGFALKGGETDQAALQGARNGAVKLPATFGPPTGLDAALPKTSSGPTVADDVSTPGRSMTQQVATVRKMKAEEASTKLAAAKPVGPRLSDPMDLVGKAPAPQITAPEIATPRIDPVKAASELRHIATYKPGRFERNNAGTPTLQGEPLDTAKAELMEHALKARDANDLDAFEAMLKRRDNSLTGPEKDFLRGVAENRFENTSDREFDALTAEGLKTMGVAATTSDGEMPEGAASAATADPINPMDGSDGLHHRELETRNTGQGIIADLRAAQDRDRPATKDEIAALDRRIEAAYPHDADMQDRMKALARAEAGPSKRGGDIPANAKERSATLDRLAEQANDPARLKAQRETQAYMDKQPPEARERNYVKRGEIRERMESHAAAALGISARMEEQRKIVETQQPLAKAGDANAKRLVNDATARLGRLNTALEAQADEIAKSGAELAGLPTHPHPDLDKRGADIQEATEMRARTQRELKIDAGLTAGTLGAATLAKAGKKGVALVLGRGVTAGQAATNFARGFNREIAKAAGKSGIDMSDAAAVARWAKVNPQIARQATAKALGDAATGVISDHAAGKLAEKVNVGPIGEELLSKGIEAAFEASRREKK